jgi:hypothetical protein
VEVRRVGEGFLKTPVCRARTATLNRYRPTLGVPSPQQGRS